MASSNAVQWLSVAADVSLPATFQAVLNALEHPGAAVRLAGPDNLPWPLNEASAGLLAAWVNQETPVWTDLCWASEPVDWLLQTCGCSLVTEPCMAKVGFVADPQQIPPLKQFFLGEDERPEKFTTLIAQVSAFPPQSRKLRGAVAEGRCCNPWSTGLPVRFWSDWGDQRRHLSLGIDVFLTCGDSLVALPRGLQPT